MLALRTDKRQRGVLMVVWSELSIGAPLVGDDWPPFKIKGRPRRLQLESDEPRHPRLEPADLLG
jgi:hypothetical protein